MLEILIDNIFVMLVGSVFQQTVGIPMGTKCAPLLVNLSLYSYEADFIQGLLKKNEKQLARYFNFTFRYIYRWCPFTKQFYVWWFCWSHLPHWPWNKGYHRYRLIWFMPWPIPRNWQWGAVKNETTTRDDLNFPIVNFQYVATFKQRMHMELIRKASGSLIEGCF